MPGTTSLDTSTSTADSRIWTTWVGNQTGNTTITVSSSSIWTTWVTAGDSTDTIWVNWVGDTRQTSSTTTWYESSRTWDTWNAQQAEREERRRARQAALPKPNLSPAEAAAVREAQRRVERERQAAALRRSQEQAARQAAVERAERLLESVLSPAQREQLARERCFVVEGRHARYRIRRGRVGNVDVVGPDGRIRHRLCAHPVMEVPNADTMVAQKLMLELQEDEFLRLANVHNWEVERRPVLPPLVMAQPSAMQ